MGEVNFNHFMELWNQLAIVAENFDRSENLYPELIPIKTKDLDELPKLAHKVIVVVDRA